MIYNAALEEQVDEVTTGWGMDVVKKKMLDSVAYMVQSNLAFGTLGDKLAVSAPENQTAKYMKQPGVHEFIFGKARGYTMKNIFMAGGDNLKKPMFKEFLET